MEPNQKPVLEVPKLIKLDGTEITEDRLLKEITADWNVCLSGHSPNKSAGATDSEIA